MSELTEKEKSAAFLAFAVLAVEFLARYPLWFILLGYLLWITGAGIVGWVLFGTYFFVSLLGFSISKMLGSAAKALEKSKQDERLESNSRFDNARTIDVRER